MAQTSQSPEFATVLGPDATFKGDLQFDSAAKVLGRFEGCIKSKGMIHIAKGSACKATVSAKEVAVEGRIEGNVEAGDRIEVKPTGIVVGDIVAARMTMAEGASINGHCRIGPNGQAPEAVRPAVSAEAKPEASGKTQPATAKAK
jgi:cytoskeletal protein CcmA (bactofilin family)